MKGIQMQEQTDGLDNVVDRVVDGLIDYYHNYQARKELEYLTSKIHTQLVLEDRHDTIALLNKAAKGDGGYGTLVVPPNGFSENDHTHFMIIDWCDMLNINVLNVPHEIAELQATMDWQTA